MLCGILWAGLSPVAIRPAVSAAIAFAIRRRKHVADDIGKQGTNAIIFASLGSLGGVALISGISLLLAKTYIIDDYRAEGFNLQPELFVSPEMTGIGFSGRF